MKVDGTVHAKELIDTLWNVNVTSCIVPNTISGINRYIMECKF